MRKFQDGAHATFDAEPPLISPFRTDKAKGAACAQGPTITARALRKLGPTIADAFGLFLHERLPLGTWLADGLSKIEASTAKSAEMPLTYLDDAARLEKQKVIKTLVWQTVDRVCTPSRASEPWEAFRPEFVRFAVVA